MRYRCLFPALFLFGCAEMAAQQAQEGKALCEQRRAAGELATEVHYVTCINQAITSALQSNGYKHMDLVNLLNSHRLVLAEKVDQKKITLSEAKLQMAEHYQQFAQIEHQRNLDAQLASNMSNHTMAIMGLNMMQTGNFTGTPPTPTYAVPPPINCTSQRMGAYVNTTCY